MRTALITELSALLERSMPFGAVNVDALKAEFVKLMKNVERVKDYREADALRDAMRVWRDHLDDTIYKLLVPQIRDHVQAKYGVPQADLYRPEMKHTKDEIDKWVAYWEKTLREATYQLISEISLPLDRPDDSYWTHQKKMSGQWWASQGLDPDAEVIKGVFTRFKEKSPKWLARVKRLATPAWKALKDYLTWTESAGAGGKGVMATVPVRETANLDIEGFKVRLVDYEDDQPLHVAALARTRLALKLYRGRAAKVFPWLLQNPLPFHLEADCGFEWAGRYEGGHVKLCALGMNAPPNKGAHIIAHEMGHHIWSTYLSQEAAEFWRSAILADRGTLDLVALQKVWKENAPEGHLLDLDKVLESDPTLYLQVQTLTHGWANFGKSVFFSLEELDALIAGGTVQYPVPNNPITAYAVKNPEEAFCEAFGMLVGYGPRTVLPMVRQWLGMVLPAMRQEAAEPPSELPELTEVARTLAEKFVTKTVHYDTLELFDFDDTLFRSPYPPGETPAADTHTKWWADARSLKPPHVGERPASELWVNSVVRGARKAIANPATFTALVSGRAGYEKPLRRRIEQLLKDNGLRFDEVHLNPSTQPTVQWKVEQGRAMLARLPDVKTLRVWDDRADILSGFAALAGELGIQFDPKLVVAASEEAVQPTLPELVEAGRAVIACGDCYRFAAQWEAPSDQDGVVVVHGTAQEPLSKNAKRFPHAWVEWHGKAFDWQTQATKPDGVPLETYYELWKAKPKKRYSSIEAKALAIRNKHWGPW